MTLALQAPVCRGMPALKQGLGPALHISWPRNFWAKPDSCMSQGGASHQTCQISIWACLGQHGGVGQACLTPQQQQGAPCSLLGAQATMLP